MKELKALAEPAYTAFNKKLLPSIDEKRILGVRIPVLRKYAKKLFTGNHAKAVAFMNQLPHYSLEENHLHAFLIECMQNFDETLRAAEVFLPYIDNWQTCDSFSPRVFKKHPEKLYPHILRWLASSHEFTIRFGIGLLLRYYLDARFQPEMLGEVAAIETVSYYVRMMIAWYFSIALVKQYDAVLPYLIEPHLDFFTHNKTIQKACESRQISPERKAYLKTLKVRW